MTLDFVNISWSEVDRLTKILAKKIKDTKKEFSSISTISRGGLVSSRLIDDQLGIETILVDAKYIPRDSVFVDDIFDSGDTFKKIISRIEKPNDLVYTTLFARKGKKYPRQLTYAKQTKSNEYVVYPWDKFEYKRMKKSGM